MAGQRRTSDLVGGRSPANPEWATSKSSAPAWPSVETSEAPSANVAVEVGEDRPIPAQVRGSADLVVTGIPSMEKRMESIAAAFGAIATIEAPKSKRTSDVDVPSVAEALAQPEKRPTRNDLLSRSSQSGAPRKNRNITTRPPCDALDPRPGRPESLPSRQLERPHVGPFPFDCRWRVKTCKPPLRSPDAFIGLDFMSSALTCTGFVLFCSSRVLEPGSRSCQGKAVRKTGHKTAQGSAPTLPRPDPQPSYKGIGL